MGVVIYTLISLCNSSHIFGIYLPHTQGIPQTVETKAKERFNASVYNNAIFLLTGMKNYSINWSS